MTAIQILQNCREALARVRIERAGIGTQAEASREVMHYGELLTLSREVLRDLPKAQLTVLWHRYCMDMSLTETAEALGYARRSVVRIQQEALDALKGKEYGG